MTEVSAFQAPDAVTLDGTEHILISQSGNVRKVLLSTLVNLTPSALILPSADPHVNGALWNNAGTVTVSSG